MDYLDELDNSALQALTELGGGLNPSSFPAPSTPQPSVAIKAGPVPTSKRPTRFRLVPASYLLRLEHPLATPHDVANTLGLPRVPPLETGCGEDGTEHFCRLSQSDINTFAVWAAQHPQHRFTKIRLCVAHKSHSDIPLLGRDPTLPQHRGSPSDTSNTFPVQYFFYGTLASPSHLSRLFGIPECEISTLKPAVVLDGRIRTWAGKYRALVDSPGSRVDGFAFTVKDEEQEEALRVYEGDSYEVVKARIMVDGREVEGRAFRFVGFGDELSG